MVNKFLNIIGDTARSDSTIGVSSVIESPVAGAVAISKVFMVLRS